MEKLFSFEKINDHLSSLTKDVLRSIRDLDPRMLEGIGEDKYLDFLYQKSVLYMPELLIKSMSRSDRRVRDKDKELFANGRLQKIEYQYELTLHIPLSGTISKVKNVSVLSYKPIHQFKEIDYAYLVGTEIQIRLYVSNVEDNNGDFEKEKTDSINLLIQTYGMLKQEVDSYNDNLKKVLRDHLSRIKDKYKHARAKIDRLKIPLKGDVKSAITVKPHFRKPIKLEQFISKNQINQIEPYVSYDVYMEIIQIINDCLKNIERMPSLYKDREENDLRDFILFVLDPHFKLGSATGETFNKKGKTDILLRYEASNVFIAECKYWRGIKTLRDTIDQLLGYLTWRDSKSAIIFFVKQKDVTGVIKKIRKEIVNHKNYVQSEKDISESVLLYRFHLDENLSKEIHISVMVCHTYDELLIDR